MQPTVQAKCPGCQAVLRIPAEWAGKAVKCKKCGAVARSAGTVVSPKPIVESPSAAETLPTAPAAPPYGQPPMQPPAVSGYPYAPPPGYPYPMPPAPGYAPAPYGFGPPPGYPYAPPPGYPPNAFGYPPAQDFVPPAVESFANPPAATRKRRYKKSNNTFKVIVLSAFGLLLAGGVAAGILFKEKWMPMADGKSKPKPTDADAASPPAVGSNKPAANLSAAYPRRMLFMSVTKYLYCNTLNGGINGGANGNGRSELAEAAKQLAFQFRVPTDKENNQLFLLTDAEGALTAGTAQRPMLKGVLLETAKRFSESSREQDHVVFYFGGHATFKGGKAYLVPVEGDLNEPDSLVPLEAYFALVKSCPAQQKLVVFDVCRANTDGNIVRPGSEPMSEELEKALLAAPAGANIQVITACGAGQNAAELQTSDGEHYAGSAFLNALRVAARQGQGGVKSAKPDDPFAAASWVEATIPILEDYVGVKMKPPVPKLSTGDLMNAVAFNAEEPVAKRFDFPDAPKTIDPSKLKDVFALLDLKPIHIKGEGKPAEEALDRIFPFQAEALAGYKLETLGAEMEEALKPTGQFPLRTKTVLALKKIRDKWGGKEGGGKFSGVRTTFAGDSSNNVKDEIKKEQIPLAEITDDLDELAKELEPLLADLDKEESKAWKASFLYALAQAKSRLAYLHEANLALGKILTDSIPEQLDKALGLQLVSVEKMQSKKEFRKFADEAKLLYDKLATENKGTPWEVLAKRARVESLGLDWKAYAPSKDTDDDKMDMKK